MDLSDSVFYIEAKASKAIIASDVEAWICPHGNQFCLSCGDCKGNDVQDAHRTGKAPGTPNS